MKMKVCSNCDNCGEDGFCTRYGKPISRVGSCGVYSKKKFNKPFNSKGVFNTIRHREKHPDPLHLRKETK